MSKWERRLPERLILLPGEWQPLSEQQYSFLMQRMNSYISSAAEAGQSFSNRVQLLQAWCTSLEFYPGFVLNSGEVLQVGHRGWFDALCGPGFCWCLDGTSDVLHGLNRGSLPTGDPRQPFYQRSLIPLRPSPAARAYLRFFAHAIRSEGVTFKIVESVSHLRALNVSEPERFARHVAPLCITWADEEQKMMYASATLIYSGRLFRCRFELTPDGDVEMISDEAISEDEIVPPESCDSLIRNIRPLQTQLQVETLQ